MCLAYLDESDDQYSFVLATIAINESQVLGTAKGVHNVEEKHFGMLPDSERPVLFHCTTIRSPALHLARDQLKSKDRQLSQLGMMPNVKSCYRTSTTCLQAICR